MKTHLVILVTTMLLFPLGLKLGVPVLARYTALTLQSRKEPQQYRVTAVEGYTLVVQAPDQSLMKLRLAGLQLGDQHWQNQAASVLTLLLNSSQARVVVTQLHPSDNLGVQQAIAQLPGGLSLQQVLLADGLARLDPNQLPELPAPLSLTLQRAEAEARTQQKNIWGAGQPMTSP